MVRVLPALAPASSEWAQLELAGEEGGEYPALALGHRGLFLVIPQPAPFQHPPASGPSGL
jgi:hypothetical protein